MLWSDSLIIHTGDNVNVHVTFVDQQGQAVDVLRSIITFRVAHSAHGSTIFEKVSPDDFTVGLTAATIPLSASDTNLHGTCFYEVLVVDGAGHVVTVAAGYLTFSPKWLSQPIQITAVVDTGVFEPVYVLDFRNPRNSGLLLLLFDEVL